MGFLTDHQQCFRRMLSRCYALQNWGTNTFTEAELLARVYENAVPAPANGPVHTLAELEALRPFVVVGVDSVNALKLRRDAFGGAGSFLPSGHIVFFIEQAANGETESEIDSNFLAVIENMLQTNNPSQPGLMDLEDTEDSLKINELTLEGVFSTEQEDEISKGRAQRAYFRVTWGYQ